jgi:hypothetical protein
LKGINQRRCRSPTVISFWYTIDANHPKNRIRQNHYAHGSQKTCIIICSKVIWGPPQNALRQLNATKRHMIQRCRSAANSKINVLHGLLSTSKEQTEKSHSQKTSWHPAFNKGTIRLLKLYRQSQHKELCPVMPATVDAKPEHFTKSHHSSQKNSRCTKNLWLKLYSRDYLSEFQNAVNGFCSRDREHVIQLEISASDCKCSFNLFEYHVYEATLWGWWYSAC